MDQARPQRAGGAGSFEGLSLNPEEVAAEAAAAPAAGSTMRAANDPQAAIRAEIRQIILEELKSLRSGPR